MYKISYKLTNFLEWFIASTFMHKIWRSCIDTQPTEKINVNNAKSINPSHKNITFHIFIQIFTPSGNIGHISNEHHMHAYKFLILFCTYSTVDLQPRYTSDALYLKEKLSKPSYCRIGSVHYINLALIRLFKRCWFKAVSKNYISHLLLSA